MEYLPHYLDDYNGSELIIQEHYKTIYHHTPCSLYKYQSTYIQALPPLWDMPNYYYMYNLSSESKLIRPIRYNDFIVWGPPVSPRCQEAVDKMVEHGARLGVPLASHKTVGPILSLTLLGITVDTEANELRLPEDKLTR